MQKQLALLLRLTLQTIGNFTTPVATPVSAPVSAPVATPVSAPVANPYQHPYIFSTMTVSALPSIPTYLRP